MHSLHLSTESPAQEPSEREGPSSHLRCQENQTPFWPVAKAIHTDLVLTTYPPLIQAGESFPGKCSSRLCIGTYGRNIHRSFNSPTTSLLAQQLPSSLSSCPLDFWTGLDFVCPQLNTTRGYFAEELIDTKVDCFRVLSEWWYSTLTTWALLGKQIHSIIASFPRQRPFNPPPADMNWWKHNAIFR